MRRFLFFRPTLFISETFSSQREFHTNALGNSCGTCELLCYHNYVPMFSKLLYAVSGVVEMVMLLNVVIILMMTITMIMMAMIMIMAMFLPFSPDVDECDSSANRCAFRCFNMPGTFRCICPMGYKVAADQIHCEGQSLRWRGRHFV